MIDTAEPKLLSAGACCAARRYAGRADELGVGGHREDAPDPLQVLGGHVLQALDELAGREVLADLVLGALGELLDRRAVGVIGALLWSASLPTCDT